MQIFLLDFFSLTDSESTCLSPIEKALISVVRHPLGRNFRSSPTVLYVGLNNNAGGVAIVVLIQGCLLLFIIIMQLPISVSTGLPAGLEYASNRTQSSLDYLTFFLLAGRMG